MEKCTVNKAFCCPHRDIDACKLPSAGKCWYVQAEKKMGEIEVKQEETEKLLMEILARIKDMQGAKF